MSKFGLSRPRRRVIRHFLRPGRRKRRLSAGGTPGEHAKSGGTCAGKSAGGVKRSDREQRPSGFSRPISLHPLPGEHIFCKMVPSTIAPQCTALLSAIAHSKTTSSLGCRVQPHRDCFATLNGVAHSKTTSSLGNRVQPHRDCFATLNGVAHSKTTSSLGYRVQPHRDCFATLNGVAHSKTTSSLGCRVQPHRDCFATLNGAAHSKTTASLGCTTDATGEGKP